MKQRFYVLLDRGQKTSDKRCLRSEQWRGGESGAEYGAEHVLGAPVDREHVLGAPVHRERACAMLNAELTGMRGGRRSPRRTL